MLNVVVFCPAERIDGRRSNTGYTFAVSCVERFKPRGYFMYQQVQQS